MSVWVRRLLEFALTRAIGGLLTLRQRVRSWSTGLARADRWRRTDRDEGWCRVSTGQRAWWERTALRILRGRLGRVFRHGFGEARALWRGWVAPHVAAARQIETPAHHVLRLGGAPESPIHSQNPDDWEDLVMPSGVVSLPPRGMQALGDRAYAAFHLRRTFRLVK